MNYGGPLIIVAGIMETEIDGQKTFLLPAHRNTLQKDPAWLARPFYPQQYQLVGVETGGVYSAANQR
ncbi:MAG: hypothetical protein R3C59_12970 [Planctomycetaceae bacterium]